MRILIYYYYYAFFVSLKLAQVTPYFYPHVGGVESMVLELSKRFIERKHSVTVLTSLLPDTKEHEFLDGIEIVRFKPRFTAYKTPVTPELSKNIRGYDLVNAHTPPPLHAYYASIACKNRKIPLVLTYHCDPEIPSLLGKLIVSAYSRTLGSYTLRAAAKIIATTTSYAATSRTLWKYPTVVIPSAVDTERFKPDPTACKRIRSSLGLSNDEFVALFVGRLVAHKGLEYLINSAKYTTAKYIIVGAGELRRKLESQVRRENLEARVIFAGKVADEELSDYYNACNVFVLPSIARLEALGLVILEAMACGKPVIVSNLPGVRELVSTGEEGLVVEPMNEKLLVEKINFLAQHPDLCRELGEKCRKKAVSELGWDKIVDQVEKVYFEVAKK